MRGEPHVGEPGKAAASSVGYSKVTRSADIPLAAGRQPAPLLGREFWRIMRL